MGKKDLKKQYSDLDVSIIDYIYKLDPSKTKKLVPFILKVINKNLNNKDIIKTNDYNDIINNKIDYYIIELLTEYLGGGPTTVKTLKEFNEHLENNRIKNNDISQYESWDDLLAQKGIADMKLMCKELYQQIERIYEDSTWLVVKPLSFKASLAYGSGTKWCTAMKSEPFYFYKYSIEGILIYVINKINGKKFGVCSNSDEISFWNNVDNRIDSIESGIPFEILSLIKDKIDLKNNPKNFELFSKEEMENKYKFHDVEEENVTMTMRMPIEEPYLIPFRDEFNETYMEEQDTIPQNLTITNV